MGRMLISHVGSFSSMFDDVVENQRRSERLRSFWDRSPRVRRRYCALFLRRDSNEEANEVSRARLPCVVFFFCLLWGESRVSFYYT